MSSTSETSEDSDTGIQFDYEKQIPGNVYKSWQNDASSLVSKRRQVYTVCACVTDFFCSVRCLHD